MNREKLYERAAEAIKHFWAVRDSQGAKQGRKTGQRDAGSRTAVTGGKQLDEFARLVNELLVDAGLTEHQIYCQRGGVALPGYFRPTKEWDLLAVVDGKLLASIEFKSQVGPSFGNNYNNRTEEAIGSATDLWTAYREGAFADSVKPWLGYFMLLEESEGSTNPVRPSEPHFQVFEEFKQASYKMRYELFCRRLVRERLYDAACFVTSTRESGRDGQFDEPSDELSLWQFAASLQAHAGAYARYLDG